MRAKNCETTKVMHQNGTEPRSLATRTIQIARITIGDRHRKDMGDLQSLADSIAAEGLLQPIGITEDCRLVFGERRLRACRDILCWSEIEARIVNVSSIVAGEHAENEIRKQFTISERVAIGKAVEVELGKRQGRRTDLELPDGGPEVKKGETREMAARRAGFRSSRSYRDAKQVLAKGIPSLVEGVDTGKIAVSTAARIATKPIATQIETMSSGALNEARGLPKEGRNAKGSASALPKKSGRSLFPGIRAAQARDAKNVQDLDLALRLFRELIEPLYRNAENLVRARIDKEVARILGSIVAGSHAPTIVPTESEQAANRPQAAPAGATPGIPAFLDRRVPRGV